MISAAGGSPRRVAATGENVGFLSVSRNGHRLAYQHNVVQISIWRIPGPNSARKGGPPVQFISSKQADTSPKYSPDGKSILFYSNRSGGLEIWVCDSEGHNPVQLTSSGSGCPRWSPDSRWIAFNGHKEGKGDIYVISVEGGRERRVAKEVSNRARPSWSKDGRWLYFGSDRTGEDQVWKMPVQGGAEVQVTKRGGLEAMESVDGQFVYYAKLDRPGIWRAPVAGGEETQILDQGWVGGWALTGRGICFMVAPPDSSSANPVIKFYAFDNRHVTTIREFSKDVTLMYSINNPLSISPDGRWVLYTRIDQDSRDLMLVENFR
jgi:eukaryotic-like serine/threonine-protein kinase